MSAMSEPEVFIESDFDGPAERDQLLVEGRIIRIGDGIYATAKRSRISGRLIPAGALEQLINAVARRYGREIVPSQELIAYNSGRSTQIPTGRHNEISGPPLVIELSWSEGVIIKLVAAGEHER